MLSSEVVDDQALLEALRAGQDWAFEVMVRQFGGRLLRLARRLTNDDEDARDVLQSAYLRAFRALPQFAGSSRLSTWLHRIVINTALMKIRTRRRKPEQSIEAWLPAFQTDGHHVEQYADWPVPADRLLEREETRRTVRTCIQQLPESYRAVLVLPNIEELSTQEVAGALAMTQTAVKVRLHRARQALLTRLRKEYGVPAVTSQQRQHPTTKSPTGDLPRIC